MLYPPCNRGCMRGLMLKKSSVRAGAPPPLSPILRTDSVTERQRAASRHVTSRHVKSRPTRQVTCSASCSAGVHGTSPENRESSLTNRALCSASSRTAGRLTAVVHHYAACPPAQQPIVVREPPLLRHAVLDPRANARVGLLGRAARPRPPHPPQPALSQWP